MIHSLSGGVIKENGIYTFVKVAFCDPPYDERPFWYICPFSEVEEGSFIHAPIGTRGALARGRVLKVERNLNEQLAPVPINRIKEIARLEEKI